MTRLMPATVLAVIAAAALTLGACGTDATTTRTSTAPAASKTPTTSASTAETASTDSPGATTPAASMSACDRGATLVETTEGPYYTSGAPNRSTLADADTVGTPLILTGTVFDADCQPVPGATIDVWQADGAGTYDNSGYKLRGVLTTDADGRYSLTTVIPGIYPSRTEHIHIKINAPDGPVYTTQLFFPGAAQNDSDRIFDETMLVTVQDQTPDQMLANYDFVLP